MTIHEIVHDPKYSIKKATITLDYDEIRDISNLLTKTKDNGRLTGEFFLLFELVKNGCIDGFTVKHLNEYFPSRKNDENDKDK